MTLTKSDKVWLANTFEHAFGIRDKKVERKFVGINGRFDQMGNRFATIDNKLDEMEERFEAKLTEFRDDFYTKIDPILKEVAASREERLIISQHLSDQNDRIEKVEKKLNIHSTI
jgi:predicted transcriptional regulator